MSAFARQFVSEILARVGVQDVQLGSIIHDVERSPTTNGELLPIMISYCRHFSLALVSLPLPVGIERQHGAHGRTGLVLLAVTHVDRVADDQG